ncbi:MAG: diguanylate cyclase [Deltaproteobacteria bacterium]|nr:diguanylate cyclase [Deltaproteobacteria bacterium]
MNLSKIKKSLRVKITLFFLVIGLAPIIIGSVIFYFTIKKALFENVFKELQWTAAEITDIIEKNFNKARSDLLFASTNPAFKLYYTEPGKKDVWLREQHNVFLSIRKLYKYLDESCFIERSGKEVGRIVYDTLAEQKDLSPDESVRSFFAKTFVLNEGDVFTGRPEISEDTRKWVLPYATPITIGGVNVAIFHFEITLSYFQDILRGVINPERLIAFILNENGEYLAHTAVDISLTGPLPRAKTLETSPSFNRVVDKIVSGGGGMDEFSQGGERYYIHYRPVAPDDGHNENRWTVAVIIPAKRVYVEASIVGYMTVLVGFAVLVVVLFSYMIGKWVTYPITTLVMGIRNIASGDFFRKVSVTSQDELGELARSFNQMVDAITARDAMLKDLATTDGLTGLYNHRHFKNELEKEIKRAKRYNRSMSLVMADIDHFKSYNDTHGHPKGDVILKMVAELFRRNRREVDIAARYGGEEFIIILPETGAEAAFFVAEGIRGAIEEHPFPMQETQPGGNLTASFGVATFPEDGDDAESLMAAVDKRLYMAKAEGRNRVYKG